jgi:hypothetical protein
MNGSYAGGVVQDDPKGDHRRSRRNAFAMIVVGVFRLGLAESAESATEVDRNTARGESGLSSKLVRKRYEFLRKRKGSSTT